VSSSASAGEPESNEKAVSIMPSSASPAALRIDHPSRRRTTPARKSPARVTSRQAVPPVVDPPVSDPLAPTVAPRKRGRPPRLSRPAIFKAALELIDAEGAQALTMRRLGAEMGVEAMSLYRHVSSKDALLDGIGGQLMSELDVGEDDGDWAVTANRLMLGIRAIAKGHPAAFALVGLRALNTVEAMRPVEALLVALRNGGFPPDRAVAAFRLFSGYLRGYTLSEIAGFTLTSANDGLTGEHLEADEFPAIRGLAAEFGRDPTDDDFRAGIETIAAGLRIELATIHAAA
jgi:AcrR family transcriptional regulator